MDAITFLTEQANWAHHVYRGTIAGVTPDQIHFLPPGAANPLVAAMVHIVVAEDALVQGALQGGAPLFASSFAGKTGVDDPQWTIRPEWARTVQIQDWNAFQAYTGEVFAATDRYIHSLHESDLDRMAEMPPPVGSRSVGWVLGALIIGHMHNLAGEISAIKGVQGLRGYPF